MTERPLAIVTGAGGGIPRRVLTRLQALGHDILAVDRDDDALASLSSGSGELQLWSVDAIDHEQVEKLFRTVDFDNRNIVLVNGVGGDTRRVDLTELDEAALHRSYLHNVQTAFTFMRLTIPLMRAQGWGRIVNLASIAGRTYSVFSNAAYVAAKAAVVGLTKQAAYELAPYGISVNAVAHGPIRTDRIDASWQDKAEAERTAILDRIPVGRLGSIEEAAAMVVPLCLPAAGYTTGAVIDVNGGLFV